MKKAICIILAAALALAGAACGVKRIETGTHIVSGEIAQPGAGASFTLEYTREQSARMASFMLGGRFTSSGKTLYGSKHTADGAPYLCAMKFTAGKNGMYVRDTAALDEGCDASYLCLAGENLYYIRTDNKTGERSIRKVPAAFGTSGAPGTVYSGECDFLQIAGERLYFTDEQHHLISTDTDGKDVKEILTDKGIYYPYLAAEGLLFYQDDAGGESLHMRYLPTGFDIEVAKGKTAEYTVSGGEIYYYASEDGENYLLKKTDMNSFLSSFEPAGGPNAGYRFSAEPAEGNESLIDGQRESGEVCQYICESFEIYYEYSEEGLVKASLFYEPSEKRTGYIEVPKG